MRRRCLDLLCLALLLQCAGLVRADVIVGPSFPGTDVPAPRPIETAVVGLALAAAIGSGGLWWARRKGTQKDWTWPTIFSVAIVALTLVGVVASFAAWQNYRPPPRVRFNIQSIAPPNP